jgi:hypothetical protein
MIVKTKYPNLKSKISFHLQKFKILNEPNILLKKRKIAYSVIHNTESYFLDQKETPNF